MGYYPRCMNTLTHAGKHGGRQCQVGSLTGAVALLKGNGGAQRFPQNGWKSFAECKGRRELDCETYKSSRTKVGLSDPAVPYGRAVAQRIKATLGITGLSPPRVHIDGEVWHLDVGSSHPGAVVGPKGLGCSPIKAVRELGSERRETVRSLSVAGVGNLRGSVLSTRGPGWTYRWCTSCSARGSAG